MKNCKSKYPGLRDILSFRRFVRPYRLRVALAITASVVVGMLDGVIPLLLKPFMDDVILGDGTVDVAFFPILIILFAVVQSGISFAAEYLTTWSGRNIGRDVKLELFDRLLRSDPAVFDKSASGDIIMRYNTDADTAANNLVVNAKLLLNRFVTSFILIAVMFYISWILALVAVGCLLLAVVPMNQVRRKIKQFIRETVQSDAVVTTNYTEAILGNRVIASYSLYSFARERLSVTLERLFRLGIKRVQRTSLLSFVMHFATSAGIAATVWLQGYLIMTGRITPGDFVAFMTALLSLYQPLKRIGSTYQEVQNSLMAIQRILVVLERRPRIVSASAPTPLDGVRRGVSYQAVNFSYEQGKPVLRDIDLFIPSGQSVAFVGDSGGGKTTLVNLLPRFYDVDSGGVYIDGVDVREIELENLRRHIAIVFQDNFLFGGTIRENILLGKQDATDDEIERSVQAACLVDFVSGLEQGLDSQIGERGVMLSGGQRQRIAIARAFIKDAPIVILDEATSALDNKSEAVVQQAIENLMRNKTVLIVAHRLSTVRNANRIVVLQGGRIVETGTHDELREAGGAYAELYRRRRARGQGQAATEQTILSKS